MVTKKTKKSHKEFGKIRNQDMATFQSGVAILNWLKDENTFSQALPEIEENIKHISILTKEERAEFISSFS